MSIISCKRIFLLIIFHILNPTGPFCNTMTELWGASSVNQECQFKCNNGQHPKPNPNYVVTSNGCGIPGVYQMPKLPDYIPSDRLEDCCSSHDICYGTCNADKNDCDVKFEHCLHTICSDLESRVPGNFVKNGCRSIAKLMHTAVTVMGCKHYLDAQEEACVCNGRSINYDL